jgi:hypothetical protein
MLEEPDPVVGMLEFVDVGPNLSLPGLVMGRRFPASSAAGMQRDHNGLWLGGNRARQFDEDAAYFLDFFVLAEQMFIAQKVSEA